MTKALSETKISLREGLALFEAGNIITEIKKSELGRYSHWWHVRRISLVEKPTKSEVNHLRQAYVDIEYSGHFGQNIIRIEVWEEKVDPRIVTPKSRLESITYHYCEFIGNSVATFIPKYDVEVGMVKQMDTFYEELKAEHPEEVEEMVKFHEVIAE